MTDQEAPPDDDGEDRGQGRAGPPRFARQGSPPAEPVGRQQGKPDRDEMLLDVEKAERIEMTRLLQRGPDVDTEVQIDGGAQHGRDHVEQHDRIGERGWPDSAEAPEERAGPRARRNPRRQCLVGDGAEQRHRDQAVENQERGRHRLINPRTAAPSRTAGLTTGGID